MNLCLAILGPTACGKSEFAIEVAKILGGEILCMDSTTVYKGFNIGAAKPSKEQLAAVPHHLIDIMEPNDEFHAKEFVDRCEGLVAEILERNKVPIVVGGTYFYMRALQYGMFQAPPSDPKVVDDIEKRYFVEEELDTKKMHDDLAAKDPEAAKKIHPNDRYRLVRAHAILESSGKLPSQLKATPTEAQKSRYWMKYALTISRHTLSDRITARTQNMIQDGLVKETQELMEKFPNARALGSIGYAEAVRHLQGDLDEKALKGTIIEKTRQLAKRQLSWLRSDPEVRVIDTRDLPRVKLEFENLRQATS